MTSGIKISKKIGYKYIDLCSMVHGLVMDPQSLFVCLSCGLAPQSTAMVMSGHYLHFMGILPNILRCMTPKMCLNNKYTCKYPSKPKRLICMDDLTSSTFLGRLSLSA